MNKKIFTLCLLLTTLLAHAQPPFAQNAPAAQPPQLTAEDQKALEEFFKTLAAEIEKEIEKLPPEEKEKLQNPFGAPAQTPPPLGTKKDNGKEKGEKLPALKKDTRTNFLEPWGEREEKAHGALPDFKTDALTHYLDSLSHTLKETQNIIRHIDPYHREKETAPRRTMPPIMRKESWNNLASQITQAEFYIKQVLDEPTYHAALFKQESSHLRSMVISFQASLEKIIRDIENLDDEDDDLPAFESREAFEAFESEHHTKIALLNRLHSMLSHNLGALIRDFSHIAEKSKPAIKKEIERVKKIEEEARKKHASIIEKSKYYRTPYYPSYYPDERRSYGQSHQQQARSGSHYTPSQSSYQPQQSEADTDAFDDFDYNEQEEPKKTGLEQILGKGSDKDSKNLLIKEDNIKKAFIEAVKTGDLTKAEQHATMLDELQLELDEERKKKEDWKKTDADYQKAYTTYQNMKANQAASQMPTRNESEQSARASAYRAMKEKGILEDLLYALPELKQTVTSIGLAREKLKLDDDAIQMMDDIHSLKTEKQLKEEDYTRNDETIKKLWEAQTGTITKLADYADLFDSKEVTDRVSSPNQRFIVRKIKELAALKKEASSAAKEPAPEEKKEAESETSE
jgi:hypothetical protein